MAYKFVIEYQKNGSVRITKRNSQAQIYRMPYELLTPGKCEFEVRNPFIVYILYKHNISGKDYIYVGMSKNGIFGRPKQHKDKFQAELCYILTQEYAGTFFNDGTIQYLEHEVNQKVNATNAFINTTENTNTGTANPSDEDDCNDYLREAYMMLKVLGLDLDRAYPEDGTGSADDQADDKAETKGKPELVLTDAGTKVGEFIRQNLENLLASDYLDMQKFEELCTVEGSRDITHRNLPLFWKLKKGEGKKDHDINYFLVLFAANAAFFLFNIISLDGSDMPPRVLFTVYSMEAMISLIAYGYVHEQKWPLRILEAAVIGYLTLQIVCCNIVVGDHFTTNALDNETADMVYAKISEYEQETGVKVTKICAEKDIDSSISYECINTGEMNQRTLYYSLNLICLRSGRMFTRTKMDSQIYDKYFKGKDWNYPDMSEQLVIKGDSAYWMLY